MARLIEVKYGYIDRARLRELAKQLSGSDMLVLCHLLYTSDMYTNSTLTTAKQIAEECEITRQTAGSALSKLLKLDAIRRKGSVIAINPDLLLPVFEEDEDEIRAAYESMKEQEETEENG